MIEPLGSGVLRGVELAATAVRLARPSPGDDAAVAHRPTPTSDREEAVRRGYEEGLRQGRSDGLRAGREEGLRAADQEASARIDAAVESAVAQAQAPWREQQARLQALASSLERSMGEVLDLVEDEVLALCWEAVCRVISAEAVQRHVVQAHLRDILARTRPGPMIEVHVHPADLALLEDMGADPQRVRWLADEEVALGGCIVAGRGSSLDARFEVLLSTCKEVLLEQRALRRSARRRL